MYEKVLLKNLGRPNSASLETYRSTGGYEGLRKAVQMQPQELVDFVKQANLRGRGGAGFPAGTKWSFLPPDREVTYLCINADESEPPTFANRVLMEHDPHQVIEGSIIAGYATRTTTCYFYMRGEFTEQFHIMQRAVDEAYAAGFLGKNILGSGWSMEFYVHRGAGAYVCGEETGLIESLEGKRGWPRIKPPFPAVEGVFRKPTVVNNVETVACLPHLLTRGLEWWKTIGPPHSLGPKLFCISGAVNKPGCYEAPCTITVRDLIYGDEFGGGMRGGKKVKAVFPGGISMGVLRGDTFPKKPAEAAVDYKKDHDELDCILDFEDVKKYDLLGLGTAAAVVVCEDDDLRDVLVNVCRFYAWESCGQCTQCREGTSWMYKIAQRIQAGAGRSYDFDLILELTANMGMMPGMSICGLPDGAVWPIRTLIQKFRPEFEALIRAQKPNAASEFIRQVNPAAYELPIQQGRGTVFEGGSMSHEHYPVGV